MRKVYTVSFIVVLIAIYYPFFSNICYIFGTHIITQTVKYITLCFLSPVAWRLFKLLHWRLTCIGIAQLLQSSTNISFLHRYELYPPK